MMLRICFVPLSGGHRVRRTSVQNTLTDNFEAGPLPPMGPDGAPTLEPVRPLPADPPRLCNAGPCRHYHQFQIQLDAQNPMAERKPDGTVVHHGRVFHVQTHHYCYPDVGIETELGSEPVLACNRWVPITRLLQTKASVKRAFARELGAFVAKARLHERLDAEAREGLDAEVAAAPARISVTVILRDATGDPIALHGYDAEMGETYADIAAYVLESAASSGRIDPDRDHAYEVGDQDGPITNTTATLEQLGATGPLKIQITIKPKENA